MLESRQIQIVVPAKAGTHTASTPVQRAQIWDRVDMGPRFRGDDK